MYASIKQSAFAALLFGALANGHMVMRTPKPFGNPNNSPLDASGSDFPCKGGPYDRGSVSNVMAIGEPQTLSFTGSAVHGGGSCQVSLTTDLQPTKNSKWMVIKSIEGGCPASVAGNLPADPNGTGASTFQYTIPDGIAPGEYVIAWTWINKIGNREFYMNCGPATVTGAKKKRYDPQGVSLAPRQNSFPDMFVANLASVTDCTTPESFDYVYPNPGPVAESAGTGPYTTLACGGGGNNPAPQPTGAAGGSGSGTGPAGGAPATPTGGAGNGQGQGSGAGNGQGQGSGNGQGQGSGNGQGQGQGSGNGQGQGSGNGQGQGSGNGQGQGSGNGQGQGSGNGSGFGGGNGQGQGNGQQGGTRTGGPGSFATGAAPLPSGVGAAPAEPAAPAVPAAPAAGSGGVSPPASSGSSSGSASTGTCSDEGAWICLPGGTSYQRCASGSWTPAMPLAAGTQCTPGGASANFQISRAGGPKYKRQPIRLAV